MYINTFKYTPKDVSCQLCTEYVKKLGCTSSSQSPLISVSADGENCARSLAPPLPTKSATLRGPQTCPWLAERIEAGVVGYREAVLETFPHLLQRHGMDKVAFQQLRAQFVKRPPVKPFRTAGCRTLEIHRQVLKGGLRGQRADAPAGHTDGVPLFQIPLLFMTGV